MLDGAPTTLTPLGRLRRTPPPERETVLAAIASIRDGPAALRLSMEICAKCGVCAEQCPIYQGEEARHHNPAHRSDLIRSLYKRHSTAAGKLLSRAAGLGTYQEGEILEWVERFYECTGCRRCAVYCPLGIDNSVITRKGRAVVNALNLTPRRLLDITNNYLDTGNTEGRTREEFFETVGALEREMARESAVEVRIPIDVVGTQFFYLPPVGDVFVNPRSTMGVAKVFHVAGLSWTMSSRCFDGANHGLFTGDDVAMRAINKRCVEEARRLQVKNLVIGECGHSFRVFKAMMEKEKWWGELPFNVTSVLEITSDLIRRGAVGLDRSRNRDSVTYHDPCNFSRSCGIVEEPRIVLRAACADFREMSPGGTRNWCCGGGGGLSALDSARDFRVNVSGKKKVEQIRQTGAKVVVAPCGNCKVQLAQLVEHHHMDVAVSGVHDLVNTAIIMK